MQLINFLQTTFVYNAEESLDLINAPNQESDYALYTRYNSFINGVLAIYGTQKNDGTIPVFWTTQNTDSTLRYADSKSTLKKLDPQQTYYIIAVSNDHLPLTIPHPVGSTEFLKNNISNNSSTKLINFNNNVKINPSYKNIQLDDSTENTHFFNIEISGLIPNYSYAYNIKPIFSNWPCDFSKLSGSIDVGGPVDANGYTSSNIKSFFEYKYCNDLSQCYESVPYTLIDRNNPSYINNIFSIFELEILQNNNKILSDSFTITCNECIDIKKCPSTEISQSIINLNNTYYTNLTFKYYNLDPNEIYRYNISSIGSNWPSRIDNISGVIYPENLYVEDEVLYSSGSLDVLFAFGTDTEMPIGWSNLDYVPEVYQNESFMKNNIYTHLNFELIGQHCTNPTSSILIKCNNCIPTPEDCITDLKISLPYQPPNDLAYPSFLSFTRRPAAETNVAYFCCDFDQNLEINISGACSGEIYDYNFTSYPNLTISPNSGSFSFSKGVGKISHLVNLNNNISSVVHFSATHRNSGKKATDAMIIRCSGFREET